MTDNTQNPDTIQNINQLALTFATQFVRKDNKFYDVDHLGTSLSRIDVEKMIRNRILTDFSDIELSRDLLKGLYTKLLDVSHSDLRRSVQVWNGQSECRPGDPKRLVFERGAVTANVWLKPAYRDLRINASDAEPLFALFDWLFKSDKERDLFLNWFAYCVQNEAEKPSWAPFFYSRLKGTGKSTLTRIMTEVFGEENTAVQNNVDKLTQQFNATLLRSKLVICEETQLRQGSAKGNAIKTFITDPYILIEQKGREQVRARNISCFVFTSNFLPDWMEPGERRYAVFDVDHDGGAGGSRADEFAELVGRVHEFLDDPANVARFYNWLRARDLPVTFNAKSLNIVENATTLMKRLQQTSGQTNIELLEEFLNAGRHVVVPLTSLADFVRKELNGNTSQIRHLMNELGWTKSKVKWGGLDYAKAIWARPGYKIDKGKVYGEGCDGVPIRNCLEKTGLWVNVEIIQ